MTTFTLTREHVDLLRAMEWQWDHCEFGAPAVDCKRPFGSSSGIYGDIAAAVGWVYDPDDQEQEDELGRLYRETLTALMVGLSCGLFEPGEYERTSSGWERVAER